MKHPLSRRDALRATSLLGATSLLNINEALAIVATPVASKTLALTAAEIAAIEAALGKKGDRKSVV